MTTTRLAAFLGTLVMAATIGWSSVGATAQVAVAGGDGDERHVLRKIEILGDRGSSIGVAVRDLDERDVAQHKLTDRRGVLIAEVADDGPAARAGFRTGDVVVSFDGEPVRSARQFARIVEESPAGRAAKATIVRGGSRLDLDVTPGSASDTRTSFRRNSPVWPRQGERFDVRAMPELRELERLPELMADLDFSGGGSTLGVSVQSMTPELAEHFGARGGVLVSAVRADSPAARAGLEVGDVITGVNSQPIDSAGDLRRLLRESENATVTIGVVRDRKVLSVEAILDRPDRAAGRRRWTV